MSADPARRKAPSPVDRGRLLRAADEFLQALGVIEDPAVREATARRVSDAWSDDLLSGYGLDPAALLEPIPHQGEADLVLVRDVEFTSFCVHHLLPFSGVAHVAYVPGDRITGISKVARLVDALARRLQIQEHLTRQILDALEARLQPRGAGVVLEAEHLCMTARGIRSRGSRVVTTSWSGTLRENPSERDELLRALGLAAGS